jgi:uncharacterized protein
MALSYASPGVYVEEVDRGTKPIEAVGTSTAAFVGITAEASLKAINAATGERVVVESRLNKATLVTSWTQYTDIFGEFLSGAFLPDAVYGYFANGGGPCYVTSLRAINEAPAMCRQPRSPSRSKGKGGNSFKVVSKFPGPGANGLSVWSNPAKSETSPYRGQGIQDRDDEKREGFVGDAAFELVTISDVGPTNLP